MIDWEMAWSPYDEATYAAVLNAICPNDVVLDIGAGDFRLARRMAAVVRQVTAWEIQPDVLELGLKVSLPANVTAVLTDARYEPIPPGVTVAVLLMRHCTHFQLYAEKLAAAGCRWLLTNARWRMDVEKVDLLAGRMPYTAVSLGWFACRCGNSGFVAGPVEKLTADSEKTVHEVYDCPKCKQLSRIENQQQVTSW